MKSAYLLLPGAMEGKLLMKLTISVIESSEEVASSYISMGGFFNIALAIAILCFSPPESFKPRSPT